MTQHFSSEGEGRQYCDAIEAAGMSQDLYFHDAMALHREVQYLRAMLEKVKPDNWHEDPDWCEIVGYLSPPYMEDE